MERASKIITKLQAAPSPFYLKSRQNTPTSVVDEQVGMNAQAFITSRLLYSWR